MLLKAIKRIEAARPSQRLVESGLMVARAFGESDEPCSGRFMVKNFPELRGDFDALETAERKQAFETFLTWQATLMYRLDCVLRILDFGALIVGDEGWKELLKDGRGGATTGSCPIMRICRISIRSRTSTSTAPASR